MTETPGESTINSTGSDSSTSPPALEIAGLTVTYPGTVAVHDVSFRVPGGAMAAMIGPNGAGKSTALRAMTGLLTPDHGTVRVLGRPMARMRRRVAYVPQRSEVDWTFPISTLDTALLGTYPSLGLLRRPRAKHRDLAREALAKVGMDSLADRQIGRLSGGQQQRVFLARALAQQADVILLDEPFAGIDATSEHLIVDVLHALRDAGTAILAVHHDLGTAQHYFDHALLLNRSLLAGGPVADVLVPETLAQAYAAARLADDQR